MRKLSQIDEGMWKSGVNRAKNNEDRQEDKLNSNVYELKEIDLGDFCPFYIADVNLKVNNDEYFSFDEWKTFKSQIEKTGWRMPKQQEWEDLIKSGECEFNVYFPTDTTWCEEIFIKSTKKRLVLSDDSYRISPIQFWLENNTDAENRYALTFETWLKNKFAPPQQTYNFSFENRHHKSHFIRLIRDKKPVNEGLWKDGIGRAKSGEQREEDKHHTNIENLKPVDIGVGFYFADVDFSDNGEVYFSREDMLNYNEFFAKYGWRVPDYTDFNSIDFDNKKIFRWRPDMKTCDSYVYNVYHHDHMSDDLDEVYFETEQNKQWEGWMLYENRSANIMEYFWKTHYKTGATFGQMSPNPSHTRRIRLIKDK